MSPDRRHSSRTHGLRNFSIALSISEAEYDPISPDTGIFSSLAVAINLGIEMLEAPFGREALHDLGHAFISQGEESPGRTPFTGSAIRMNRYVGHFLDRVRDYFPLVAVQKESDDVIASISPTYGSTSLDNFYPEDVGMLTYNIQQVYAMVAAYTACQGETRSRARRELEVKWHQFLFIFACATLHQLAHLFTSYLSLGQSSFSRLESSEAAIGGRWLQKNFFGGYVEIYAEAGEPQNSPGTLFLMVEDALARRIDPQDISNFVKNPRQSNLPFPSAGPYMTSEEMRAVGIRRTGSTDVRGVALPHNIRVMRELIAAPDLPRHTILHKNLRAKCYR